MERMKARLPAAAVLAGVVLLGAGCSARAAAPAGGHTSPVTASPALPSPFTVTARYTAKSLGLDHPTDLTVGPDGNVYVTDRSQRVTIISPGGKVLRRWGKPPDGKRFVFLRFKNENTTPQQVALFVEKLDGTGLRQLTPYGLAEPHEIASAQWSPDGQEIISETTQGRLFVVHPDGTGLTMIRLRTGTTQYFAFEPDWSPDGTRIVFCMYINGQEDIYTANADGSNLVQVTNTPAFENGPDWGRSPVGQ